MKEEEDPYFIWLVIGVVAVLMNFFGYLYAYNGFEKVYNQLPDILHSIEFTERTKNEMDVHLYNMIVTLDERQLKRIEKLEEEVFLNSY